MDVIPYELCVGCKIYLANERLVVFEINCMRF